MLAGFVQVYSICGIFFTFISWFMNVFLLIIKEIIKRVSLREFLRN